MNSVKQKVCINILVFAGIIFTMFYFGLIHFAEEEEKLNMAIIAEKEEAEQLKSQSEQIGEIRNAHQEWQKKTETVLKSVVQYPELFDYVIEIIKLADENNIELETAVSTKEKEQINDNFSCTYYKIKATGFFSDVMKFLVCVENSKYYSGMENVSFIAEDKSSEKILFNADLKIYMYHSDKLTNAK